MPRVFERFQLEISLSILSITLLFTLASQTMKADTSKKWLLTVPVFTSDGEGTVGLDIPFSNDASLAFHAISQATTDLASIQEREANQNTHMYSDALEANIIFQRFSNPKMMRGFHWGIGAGYRTANTTWIKQADPQLSIASSQLDKHGLAHYQFKAAGPIYMGRAGYRYVSTSLGFTAGVFMKIRHFQSIVADNSQNMSYASPEETPILASSEDDRNSLKRRAMTRVLPGIEIGWAF